MPVAWERHSDVYQSPRPANDNGLVLTRRIDELFTAWPFIGSRRLTTPLLAEGHVLGLTRGSTASACSG
jgi:putative transposase